MSNPMWLVKEVKRIRASERAALYKGLSDEALMMILITVWTVSQKLRDAEITEQKAYESCLECYEAGFFKMVTGNDSMWLEPANPSEQSRVRPVWLAGKVVHQPLIMGMMH